MSLRGRLSLLGAVAIVAAACTTGGARRPRPSAAPTAAPTQRAGRLGTGVGGRLAVRSRERRPIAGGLLDKVMKAGKLVVSTDPNYAPQSVQKPDGTFEGFDIDVATEIAKRLGVTVELGHARLGASSPPAPGAAAGTPASAR